MAKKKPETAASMRPVYTFDIETNPFDGKSEIQPFVCGLYDGKKFRYTWSSELDDQGRPDCIMQMKRVLDKLPPGIVYAHNGGRFDMFFCMDWFADLTQMMVVNDRIVAANIWIEGSAETHEFRDSYAIMPFALKQYEKETVDYRVFTVKERETHRRMILKYLKKDCTSLHELCLAFLDTFGPQSMTVGGTAMRELRKLHKFTCLTRQEDQLIRGPSANERKYYYGGRVQCFEAGIVKATPGERIIAYDINQCYPHVMRNMLHPVSAPDPCVGNEITERTYFVTVEGRNHGAFPVWTPEGLRFNQDRGRFMVSIHEYKAGIETGMFEPEDIIATIDFERAACFKKFVDHFHGLRAAAQKRGDKKYSLFYKFVANSAYGKFAQNPDNYHEYTLTRDIGGAGAFALESEGWQSCLIVEMQGFILWKRPITGRRADHYFNVATGASITGGARSLLIRAIAKAKRPLYCDTDSLICERLEGVPIHDTDLGAWKIDKHQFVEDAQAIGDRMAIAGRKVYALFDGRDCVKKASKGSQLTPEQIVKIAKGAVVKWTNNAPTFNFRAGTQEYISRNIKRTV